MSDFFINQDDVDKVKKLLESISPELRIGYYVMDSDVKNVVRNIGLYVPEKGNKEVINKLLSIGFMKMRRRKVEDGHYWDLVANYTMQVVLEISMTTALMEVDS